MKNEPERNDLENHFEFDSEIDYFIECCKMSPKSKTLNKPER